MEKRSVIEVLEEILSWIKVVCVPQVAKVIEVEFPTGNQNGYASDDSQRDALIYQLAGTDKKQTEIAKLAGCSNGTVTNRYQKWEKIGLMRNKVRLFDLEDFGYKFKIEEKEGNDG